MNINLKKYYRIEFLAWVWNFIKADLEFSRYVAAKLNETVELKVVIDNVVIVKMYFNCSFQGKFNYFV